MSCKHSRTYAVDTHDRIDCLDCDASWEGQDIVKLEANLALAVEALDLTIAQLEFLPEMFTELKDCNEPTVAMARDALKKIRGEK